MYYFHKNYTKKLFLIFWGQYGTDRRVEPFLRHIIETKVTFRHIVHLLSYSCTEEIRTKALICRNNELTIKKIAKPLNASFVRLQSVGTFWN